MRIISEPLALSGAVLQPLAIIYCLKRSGPSAFSYALLPQAKRSLNLKQMASLC